MALILIVIIPMVLGATIGEKIVNIKEVNVDNKKIYTFLTYLFRSLMLYISPFFLLYESFQGKEIIFIFLLFIDFIYGFITFFKVLVANDLFFEKMFHSNYENTLIK